MFKTPFSIKDPLAMHERCQNCDQRFSPEPGFYYGAMFISYVISGWLLLLTALLLVFYFGWTVEKTMLVVIAIGGLTYFKLMRTSRSLYIHLVVKYKGKDNIAKKQNSTYIKDSEQPSSNGKDEI
jgi:hypothetical protein